LLRLREGRLASISTDALPNGELRDLDRRACRRPGRRRRGIDPPVNALEVCEILQERQWSCSGRVEAPEGPASSGIARSGVRKTCSVCSSIEPPEEILGRPASNRAGRDNETRGPFATNRLRVRRSLERRRGADSWCERPTLSRNRPPSFVACPSATPIALKESPRVPLLGVNPSVQGRAARAASDGALCEAFEGRAGTDVGLPETGDCALGSGLGTFEDDEGGSSGDFEHRNSRGALGQRHRRADRTRVLRQRGSGSARGAAERRYPLPPRSDSAGFRRDLEREVKTRVFSAPLEAQPVGTKGAGPVSTLRGTAPAQLPRIPLLPATAISEAEATGRPVTAKGMGPFRAHASGPPRKPDTRNPVTFGWGSLAGASRLRPRAVDGRRRR